MKPKVSTKGADAVALKARVLAAMYRAPSGTFGSEDFAQVYAAGLGRPALLVSDVRLAAQGLVEFQDE